MQRRFAHPVGLDEERVGVRMAQMSWSAVLADGEEGSNRGAYFG